MTIGQFFKWFGVLLLIIIVFGFISVACGIVSLPFFAANKAIDGAKTVISRTADGDNILYQYEHFYDLREGAKQQAANIVQQKKQLVALADTYGDKPKEWPKDVRENAAFINDTINGLNMQYQSIVAKYNADSQKLNRKLFKGDNLPYTLPLDPMEFSIPEVENQ